MIKAIAIDDELPALKVITGFCEKTDILQLEKTFTKPAEALTWLKNTPVDLLFLDIQMPSTTGIEFYKSLRTDAMVVFTTAYSEYAVEGFNLNAIDYLLKPFSFERFKQAVEKAAEFFNYRQSKTPPTEEFLFLRADYSLVKIETAAILFIEGMDDYLRIHLRDQKPVLIRMTMKAILSQLPPARFMRVHRSYIVALNAILRIRNKTIHLPEKEIPIGAKWEDEFFTRYPVRR